MGFVKDKIEKVLDELLRESFSKQGTLLKQLRGDILELEFKNDEGMIQNLLDEYEQRISDLEAQLAFKDSEVAQLQTKLTNLEERITELEPKEVEPL